MSNSKMTMSGLGSMGIGILILIVIYSIVPMVGENIDNSINIAGYTNETLQNGGSQWNSTINTDIPTGPATWTTLAPLITLAAIVLVVAGFLGTLRGIRG